MIFRLYKILSSKCCVVVLKTSFVLILREMLGAAENKSSNKILTETISKWYSGKLLFQNRKIDGKTTVNEFIFKSFILTYSELAVLAVTYSSAVHTVCSCAGFASKTLIFSWLSFCSFTLLSGCKFRLYRLYRLIILQALWKLFLTLARYWNVLSETDLPKKNLQIDSERDVIWIILKLPHY